MVSSFLNTNGGIIIFGIDDRGVVLELRELNKNAALLREMIESHFGKSINEYVHVNIESFKNKNLCVIQCEQSPTAVFFEDSFYVRVGASSAISLPDVTKKTFAQENQIEGVGELNTVLVTIREIIGNSEFRILEREISGFYSEYESGHFTSAALRIGRTLEFITYAFARSWSVEIDKTTLSCLDDIQNKFDELSKNLIIYVNCEDDEKQKGREKVVRNSGDLSVKITNLVSVIDERHEIKSTHTNININSILRNIRKKYSRIETVRNEIDVLIEEGPVNRILEMRNDAAHADTSGGEREVTKDQVDDAVKNLASMLTHLRTIAIEVCNIEKETKR